jgi:hypothetical protein
MLYDLYQDYPEEWEGEEYDPEYLQHISEARSEGAALEWKTRTSHVIEDVWIKKQDGFLFFDEVLKHDFKDMTTIFGYHNSFHFNVTQLTFQKLTQSDNPPKVLCGSYIFDETDVDIVKSFVANVIKNPDVTADYIDSYLQKQSDIQYSAYLERKEKKPRPPA